jgi:hypothetical protein
VISISEKDIKECMYLLIEKYKVPKHLTVNMTESMNSNIKKVDQSFLQRVQHLILFN